MYKQTNTLDKRGVLMVGNVEEEDDDENENDIRLWCFRPKEWHTEQKQDEMIREGMGPALAV